MRVFLAALTIVLLPGSAGAQDMGAKGGKRRNSPQNAEQQKAEQQEKKAIDDAYKAALGRIPDPKENTLHGGTRVNCSADFVLIGAPSRVTACDSRFRRNDTGAKAN